MMETRNDKLLAAIDKDDLETARHFVIGEIDLNIPCSELQGAPALFLAILKGNLAMVQLLLEHGAAPNYRADEPAASIYTEKPLALAKQARMLMNWDQYHPIVQLLEKFGAVDEGAPIESRDLLEKSKAEAKRWQSQSVIESNPTAICICEFSLEVVHLLSTIWLFPDLACVPVPEHAIQSKHTGE